MMVEGEMKEISEDEFITALEFAHTRIRELNALQMDLLKQFEEVNGKVVKREYTITEIPAEIITFVQNSIKDDLHKYVHTISTKNERQSARKSIRDKAIETLASSDIPLLKDTSLINPKPDTPPPADNITPEPVSKQQIEK
jgi:polyribonucleotide nucleotidyltransferase